MCQAPEELGGTQESLLKAREGASLLGREKRREAFEEVGGGGDGGWGVRGIAQEMMMRLNSTKKDKKGTVYIYI